MSPTMRTALTSIGVLSMLLLVVSLLALCTGPYGFQPSDLGALLNFDNQDDLRRAVMVKLRLPRTIMAMLAGAALSCSGLVMQALLRNPLADPYILGVSGGAALGAIAAIVLQLALAASMTVSFAGGMLSLLLVLALTQRRGTGSVGTLLLSGVMVNAFCSALILFFLSIVPNHEASRVLFWIIGNVPSPEPPVLFVVAAVVICGVGVVFLFSNHMNLLAMGADFARLLGVSIHRTGAVLLITSTCMVATIVCQTGLLGFIGLVVPHALRRILGVDHRILVPASALGGASFLTMCDTLARVLPRYGEMPVGVLTAMLGAPLFIFLLWRTPR